MIFASWNVNSLKVRLPQVLEWLETSQTDALVLQETKLTDEMFPVNDFLSAGFDVNFIGQKTYNGVALITRQATVDTPALVDLNLPTFPDVQKRLVAATIKPKGAGDETAVRFVGGYFPNGMTPGSWKYLYKLDWLRALTLYLKDTLQTQPRLILGGDFNIAPADIDVWNPPAWVNRILVSKPEREAFENLLALGLTDSFRYMHPSEEKFSWWDYRQRGFENNHGLRIDHLLVSKALKDKITSADIDTDPRGNTQPSDHAPVTVTIEL